MKRVRIGLMVLILTVGVGGMLRLANGQSCFFGCLENVKWLCAADAYYAFPGVGPSYDLYDPGANPAMVASGSVTMEDYVFDVNYECGCSSPNCQIPCVTAVYAYAIEDGSKYYPHDCEDL